MVIVRWVPVYERTRLFAPTSAYRRLGDPIVYRAGFAADGQLKKEYKEQYPDATDEEVKQALQSVDYRGIALYNTNEMLEGIIARFRGQPSLYLTGSGNFREQMATILPYKGNRDPTHKPKYYREIKDHMAAKWGAEVVQGIEADDALATEQWANKDRSTVICTIDKDLDQIPGFHYNYVKETFYNVNMHDANTFFWHQMLEGDRTDNIPGIAGLGPKRTAKLVESAGGDLEHLRKIVQGKYQDQYGSNWEAAYHEVGNLLWMRRLPDQECPLL